MGVLSKMCTIAMVAGYMGANASAVSMDAPERVLRAATKRSDLQRRSHRIEPKFESEVIYIENETSNNHNNVFASQVKVASRKPILNLEEIEHHLEDVQCGGGKMRLSFRDAMAARDAKAASHGMHGGLIISSHQGCNPDGERTVYNVHGVSHPDEGMYLELTVKESDWEDSFDRIVVDFGHTEEDHFFRKHSQFRRDDALDIPDVTIPSDTKDNMTSNSFSLDWLIEDKTFALADFVPSAAALPNQSPLEMGCNSCSMIGQLVLTSGSIDIDSSQIDFVPDVLQGKDDGKDMSKVIKGGFMELSAQGMEGYFDLFTKPKSSGSFMIKLMTLPALGFSIPGIGKAGAFLETMLSADYDIQGGFNMGYGFSLTVPDNSSIRVDLGDPSKSGVTGFKDTELNALPFNFEQTDVSAFVSLALLPSIPIGFQFKKLVDVSVEVEMELPRLDTLITTIANADTNCKDLDAANAKRADNATVPEVEIGSLVLIEANVSMSMDAGYNLKFPGLSAVGLKGTSQYADIFSTQIALPSLCLAPEAAWAAATDVYDPVGKATSTPVASSKPASSSADHTSAPASSGSVKASSTPAPSSPKVSSTAASSKFASSVAATTSVKAIATASASKSGSTSTTCTESAAAAASKEARDIYGMSAIPSSVLNQLTALIPSAIPTSAIASKVSSLTALIPSAIPTSAIASKVSSLTAALPSLIPTSAIQSKASSIESKVSSIIATSAIQSKASSVGSVIRSKASSIESKVSSLIATTSAPTAPKDAACSCSTSIVTVTLPPGVSPHPPSANGTVPVILPTGTAVPPKSNGTAPPQVFPGAAASTTLPVMGAMALSVFMGALLL